MTTQGFGLRVDEGLRSSELRMTRLVVLDYKDSMPLRVKQPFDFRHTIWKPSHFRTDLEAHTPVASWRTFRIGEARCGVKMTMKSSNSLLCDVFADDAWSLSVRERLRNQISRGYGLNEDLSEFIRLAERVPSMTPSLKAFSGMRQSCPENLFEIAIISLLLQNTTIGRTTQMMSNLLKHYGELVSFAGVTLRIFFSANSVLSVSEESFRSRDRLGYRAKYISRFGEFFLDEGAELTSDAPTLREKLMNVRGVGPYTASIICSHAGRDTATVGLDVWNRKLLANRLLGVDDASSDDVVKALDKSLPGYQGLGATYLIEYEYMSKPVVPILRDHRAVERLGDQLESEGASVTPVHI